MTSEEISEAAERLRRWDAGEYPSAIYPDATDPLEAADNDAWDLAREFIARLTVDETDRATLRAAITLLEEIVCVTGDDRGVVLMSSDSPTHYDAARRCQIYDNENFSPLGDALIQLHEKLQEVAK